MASVIFSTNPWTEVYYSIVSGNVVTLTIDDKVIYDMHEGIEEDGWKDKLVDLVKRFGLDRPRHAFVWNLIEEGLIDEAKLFETCSKTERGRDMDD